MRSESLAEPSAQPPKAPPQPPAKAPPQPPAKAPPPPHGVFLLAVVAWLGLGLLFGGHWWVLFAFVARTPADRRACILHFLLHIVALLLTAGGGWYVRSPAAGYVQCTTLDTALLNISMSRDCLWARQPTRYIVIYVMHFVGGGWLLSSFVLDFVHLPGWTLSRDRPMAPLFCPDAPLVPQYTAAVCTAVVAVTLTWTTAFPWDDFNLNQLLAVLIGVILAVGTACLLVIRLASRRRARGT
jgi:hypothetical protein